MRARGIDGYRNLALSYVIGDPKFRLSHMSYFIQTADTVAYALQQYLNPCSYIRKKGAQKYFLRLDNVLCKVVSGTGDGIVRL